MLTTLLVHVAVLAIAGHGISFAHARNLESDWLGPAADADGTKTQTDGSGAQPPKMTQPPKAPPNDAAPAPAAAPTPTTATNSNALAAADPAPADYLLGSCRRATRRAENAAADEAAVSTPADQTEKAKAADKRSKAKARAERICGRNAMWDRIEKEIEREGSRRLISVLAPARKARCATALCWGPSNKFAIEPLAELPIGKAIAFPGSGVGRYINSHRVDVRLDAGTRFWSHWDTWSVGFYISTPSLVGALRHPLIRHRRLGGSTRDHGSSPRTWS